MKTDGGTWYIDFAKTSALTFTSTGITSTRTAVTGFGAWNASYSGWGDSFSIAVPGDFDGDHRIDLAVYNRLNDSWKVDFAADGVTIRHETRLSRAVPQSTAFLPPALTATLPPMHEASAEVGSTANTSPLASAASITRRVTTPAAQSMAATVIT